MSSVTDSTLVRNLKKLSRATLIVHGIGIIVLALAFPSVLKNNATSILYVTAMFILIVVGAFIIKTSRNVSKGVISKKTIFLPILFFSIYLIFIGISGLGASSDYYYDIRNGSILSIVSGVLFIAGPLIYMQQRQKSMITGSIVSIAAIGLLIAGARSNLNSFPTVKFYMPDLFGNDIATVGFILCGVAAISYTFLKNKNHVEFVYLIVTTGFILYAINTVIQTLDVLSGNIWYLFMSSPINYGLTIAGMIITSISGFMILASSGIALTVYLKKIFPSDSTFQDTSIQQTLMESTSSFCKKCGTSVGNDADFCKKCGTKLD